MPEWVVIMYQNSIKVDDSVAYLVEAFLHVMFNKEKNIWGKWDETPYFSTLKDV